MKAPLEMKANRRSHKSFMTKSIRNEARLKQTELFAEKNFMILKSFSLLRSFFGNKTLVVSSRLLAFKFQLWSSVAVSKALLWQRPSQFGLMAESN
jgi:hypothetical protein